MARGSSLWDRYLQAESRLVGLGLVEKRKEKKPAKKKPVWNKSKSRDAEIREVPTFAGVCITENDEKIYHRNIELLQKDMFMEDKHSLYHVGLRARLARMADYNYTKGAIVSGCPDWNGVLNAVDVFVDEESGTMYFTYAIKVEDHFPEVLESVRDNSSVVRGVKKYINNNTSRFERLDLYSLSINYIEFINALFDLDKYVKKGMVVRRNQDQLVFDIPLDLLDNRFVGYAMKKVLVDVCHIRHVVQREISPAIVDLFIANFLIPPGGLDWVHGYDPKTIIRVDGDDTHYVSSSQRAEDDAKKKADMLKKLWK